MKIVPLFNDEINTSKLLYIESVDYLNIEKIKEFKTFRISCNFSFNYLEKLLVANKCCIIIFNDYKLFMSKDRYYLKNSKLSDGYKIIFRLRNSNYIKYVTNLNSKLEILNSLFEDYKFYLDSNFINSCFIDLINLVNILYKITLGNIYSSFDKLFLERSKFIIEEYLKSLIINLNILNFDSVLRAIVYIESKDIKSNLFKIILDKLKGLKFEDSLSLELLEMISIDEVNDLYFNNLLKIIEIDKKSKNLLVDIRLDNVCKQSIDLYYSVLTRTNWLEELKYGNIMGLLLNINPKEINKNGYNLDYIPIGEITHTIIGLDQILEAYKISKTNNSYENVLSGYGIGHGNCILPLFINSKHWDFVKLYLDFNMGIIFNRNPLLFHICHKNVYKNVLINMINNTFSNENYRSDKWINLLFSVLRTNYELFVGDNSITKFKDDKKYRTTCNLNNILLDYLFSEDNNVINIIFEELIRRTFRSLYKNINILDSIFIFTINSALNYENNYNNCHDDDLINVDEFNNWISNLELNYIFSEKITLMYAIIKMKEMIMKNDFINKFDNNYGILDDDNLNFIKNFIINKKIVPENGDLFGLLNTKFNNHVNYTKDKIFSIKTFINLGLVENNKQLYDIFIQGILQRVDKCRKKALENNKVENPFIENNIVKNAGLLISHRFIKKFFGLDKNINYLYTINIIDMGLLSLFVNKMIKKTISVKKYILYQLDNINEDKREIVKFILESE